MLYLSGANRPGLLTALSAALRDLSLEVSKAVVETDAQNNKVADKFYVTKREGGKVTSDEEVANIKRVLEVLLKGRAGPATPRPKFTTQSIQRDENKRELLYTLMGKCLDLQAVLPLAAAHGNSICQFGPYLLLSYHWQRPVCMGR